MAATAKIPLAAIIPLLEMTKSGKPDVTKAAEYVDTPSEFVKGIQAMPEWQKANLRENLQSILHPSYYNNADTGIGGSAGQSMYADGGLVPRTHHADGQDPQGAMVPAEPKMTLAERIYGQPISEDARAGLLAAGLGMLSSRSPFPGVAIGEGGMAGLNTYYNAIKNRMEQAKAASEIGLQGAQSEEAMAIAKAKPIEVQNAVITNRINLLAQLKTIAAGFTANGQPVPVDIQNRINALVSSLDAISPIAPIVAGQNAAGLPSIAAPAPSTANAPPAQTSVPSVPAPDSDKTLDVNAPAQAPAAEAPKKGEVAPPASEPQKSEQLSDQTALPRPYDPSFLNQLDPAKNPQALRNRAIATAPNDPAAAAKLREEANQVEKDLMEKGYGMAPNGALVKVPGWDQWKTEQENIGPNRDYFNKQAQDAVARQYSRLQLDSIKKIVQNFEPNKLAEQFANIQGSLKSLGIDVPDSAKMNAVAFETFLKDTLRQVYADVKQFSGGVKVAELEGLEKQMAGPGLQAGTVENIVSQLEGSLDFADKHFNTAVDYRREHKGAFDQANFEQAFLKDNKLSKFVDDAYKNTSVLGATPTSKSDLIPNKIYVLTRGPDGKPIKPVRKRFLKLSESGSPIFADIQ